MTMKNLKFWILVCGFTFCILNFGFYLFAQETLEEQKEKYFKEKNYSEFIAHLEELKRKNPENFTIDYYLALSQYWQLKDLEEKKLWEEYFNLRSNYLDRIIKETENASKKAEDPKICLEAKYLNWLMHKELNNEKKDIVLKELIDLASNYTKKGRDSFILKEMAKRLQMENESFASLNLYNLYVKALIESDIPLEQLRQEADNVYREDDIYLSTQIYDQYIERLIKEGFLKEEIYKNLISIIKKFSDYGQRDVKSPDYAESLFLRLKEYLGEELDEETQYLRAYNLQRKKEYLRCAEEYETLLKSYPQTRYRDEVEFKLGIIYLYELGDTQKALDYLMNLIKKGEKKQYILSCLYHLGLYHQYQGEKATAHSFYQNILDIVEDNEEFLETTKLTKERLKEIEEERPIEYNLKTYLDSVFSEIPIRKNLEFHSLPGKNPRNEEIDFQIKFTPSETGCLVPEYKLLWSGDLGKIERVEESREGFTTSYSNLGTKIVNLVVIGPLQILDNSIEMIDVYEK